MPAGCENQLVNMATLDEKVGGEGQGQQNWEGQRIEVRRRTRRWRGGDVGWMSGVLPGNGGAAVLI